MARDIQITVDYAAPAAPATFWAEALGHRVPAPSNGFEPWIRP